MHRLKTGTREDETTVLIAKMSDGVLVTGEFSELRSPTKSRLSSSGKADWLRAPLGV